MMIEKKLLYLSTSAIGLYGTRTSFPSSDWIVYKNGFTFELCFGTDSDLGTEDQSSVIVDDPTVFLP